jgi:hypothetical protein
MTKKRSGYRYGHQPAKVVRREAKKLVKSVKGIRIKPSKWVKDFLLNRKRGKSWL